ncbi:MAG: enoyl-CoA hydratase/isomerase family protein [Ignavibacteriales bacterium]|nr:MAG: enoyl-CoA hydratase [Ignavibacteriaceae bacterium]MBW7873848.1 enoyl-CoA hydratase/isomerase family protein [Ignavibacteria bacterium]MCZ2144185.1 enoyl-CoA hydratase/isomerase family protein [Ignavibacteriales bacterium]OQY71274.1 MAG: enoyl-CoA hydratase [Ignavibacteriales bacterium UTCHB3]MBV6445824.1 Short-chain-enoyl-CoA hydratase [Ignavibacteriaceae bacterium]
MEFQYLLFSVENNIGTITMNRPDKLNALNGGLLDELERLVDSIKNNNEVRVVIITGAGEKSFVAGADISELAQLSVTDAKAFALKGQRIFSKIESLGKPVIAAVNGFALGGGCELALACHIRFASATASFGQPEVNLGTIPGYGGTQRLTRLVNSGRALEMILGGDRISAQEALSIGLANKVFEKEELMPKTVEFAQKLAAKPPLALNYALDAALAANDLNIEAGLDFEAALFALSAGTGDFKEGTSAFLEKRKAEFKGN